ncbi:MAG: hypothetical protein LBQ10_07215 [Desulfovibrio sp.]|nr:hypothetical protein [Desulfovibrio sp.]
MKGDTIRRQWKTQAKTLPLETRQAMLDALHAGRTIGEVCKAFDVSFESVCGLIDMNIQQTTFRSLRRETL